MGLQTSSVKDQTENSLGSADPIVPITTTQCCPYSRRAAKGKLSRMRAAVYQENLIETSRRGDFAHSLQTPALESSLECVKKK